MRFWFGNQISLAVHLNQRHNFNAALWIVCFLKFFISLNLFLILFDLDWFYQQALFLLRGLWRQFLRLSAFVFIWVCVSYCALNLNGFSCRLGQRALNWSFFRNIFYCLLSLGQLLLLWDFWKFYFLRFLLLILLELILVYLFIKLNNFWFFVLCFIFGQFCFLIILFLFLLTFDSTAIYLWKVLDLLKTFF